MEATSSLWCFEEVLILHHMETYGKNVDELKNMLLQTNFALETARKEAEEEMRRNDENVNQLLHFLKVAYQERDEARADLQKLLNKLVPLSSTEICPVLPSTQSAYPMNGNSGITVSDSHSYGSSPVDSILNMVSSPEVPNINMGDLGSGAASQTLGVPETDRGSAIIDNLVKGKTLPEKGKLLESVMEAGPLLQTLMVSGNLPQWRNPPPLQPYKLPPFSVKDLDTQTLDFDPVLNVYHSSQNNFDASVTGTSYGLSEMYSMPTLNGSRTSGKRQRCQ